VRSAGGLRIGETTAELRSSFGHRLRLSGLQGGAYFISTATGVIDGYLSAEIGDPNARVVTIEAGEVGCPAMRP
jgi:hypothetical protein